MCMIDDGDDCVTELGGGRYVVARKPHDCMECWRLIAVGEKYHTEAFLNTDKVFKTHKTCAHCMVAREWLSAECGGWLYSGVIEDLEEHWPDYRSMRMGRVIVGARRKWRWNGKLLPIPKIPEVTP